MQRMFAVCQCDLCCLCLAAHKVGEHILSQTWKIGSPLFLPCHFQSLIAATASTSNFTLHSIHYSVYKWVHWGVSDGSGSRLFLPPPCWGGSHKYMYYTSLQFFYLLAFCKGQLWNLAWHLEINQKQSHPGSKMHSQYHLGIPYLVPMVDP